MKQTKLKPSNIIFISIISIIVLFNILVIFKAIHLPNDLGHIIRWASLGVVFLISIVYWSLNLGTNRIISRHKKQASNDLIEKNNSTDDNQKSE